MVGRLRREEDEDLIAGYSFLASDNEEEETNSIPTLTRKSRPTGTKDVHTHVFAWGLNDKDQLGGPKGSKVYIRNTEGWVNKRRKGMCQGKMDIRG